MAFSAEDITELNDFLTLIGAELAPIHDARQSIETAISTNTMIDGDTLANLMIDAKARMKTAGDNISQIVDDNPTAPPA